VMSRTCSASPRRALFRDGFILSLTAAQCRGASQIGRNAEAAQDYDAAAGYGLDGAGPLRVDLSRFDSDQPTVGTGASDRLPSVAARVGSLNR
jgi:hypothetical protein